MIGIRKRIFLRESRRTYSHQKLQHIGRSGSFRGSCARAHGNAIPSPFHPLPIPVGHSESNQPTNHRTRTRIVSTPLQSPRRSASRSRSSATDMAAAAAAMATATSATETPLLRIRDAARRTRRRGHVRCAVASGAAEAPRRPGRGCRRTASWWAAASAGFCTAQALATKHGVGDVLVTEARARPGGNITTAERAGEGYLWEEGPNSFQPSDPVLTMAVRLLAPLLF